LQFVALPIGRRRQSPIIEIVADSDLEEPKRSGLRRTQQPGKRTNNRNPEKMIPPTTSSSCRQQSVIYNSRDRSNDRLAEKYNELRSLLLNRLNLRALTPQVLNKKC